MNPHVITLSELLVIQPNALVVDSTSTIIAVGSQLPAQLTQAVGLPLDAVLVREPDAVDGVGRWHLAEGSPMRFQGPALPLANGCQAIVLELRTDRPYTGPFEAIPGQGLQLLQSLGTGVLITGTDGRVEWANRRFEALFGFPLATIQGHRASEFLTGPTTDPALVARLDTHMQEGHAFVEEIENATAHGAPRWVEVRGEPVRDEHGNLTAYLINYEDINARKRDELLRNKERDMYEAVLKGTGDGIYLHDLISGEDRLLPGLARLFRVPEGMEAPAPGEWSSRIPAATAEEAARITQAYRQGLISEHALEFPFQCYDGTTRWMLDRGQVLERDVEGRPCVVMGVVSDIEAWKQRQIKAEREAELYRMALLGSGDGVWEMDLCTMESTWGGGMERLLGATEGSASPSPREWLTRVPPDTASELELIGQRYGKGLITQHILEYPILGDDGRERWVIDKGHVLERNSAGLPIRLVGVVTDISGVKRTEEQLAITEQRLEALFHSIGQALMFEDADHVIRIVNPVFCALVGREQHELVGQRSTTLLEQGVASLASDPSAFLDLVVERTTARRSVVGDRILLGNGLVLERDYTPVVLHGQCIGHLWIHRDISARERLEQEAQRSKDLLTSVMASVGTGIVVDLGGYIHVANQALMTMFGLSDPPSALTGMECMKAAQDIAGLTVSPSAFMERVTELKGRREPAVGDLIHLKDGRVLERDLDPFVLPDGTWANVFSYRDVSEHHQLLQALQLSKDQMGKVIDSMRSGLMMEAPDGRPLLVNAALLEQFGIDHERITTSSDVGISTHERLSEHMAAPQPYLELVRAQVREGDPFGHRLAHLTNGRVLECSCHPIPFAEGIGHLWTYVDITDRDRLEREKQDAVRAREHLLAALAEASGRLVLADDVMTELPAIFEQIGTATEVHRVYLFENALDPIGETISSSQRVEWNSGAATPQINNPDLQDVPVELFEEFIAPMRVGAEFPRSVREVQNELFRTTLEAQGIVSILILPITVRGRFWGFIGFDDCLKERQWSENELAVLRSLSSAISAAVERSLLTRERDMELEAERTVNSLTKRMMGLQRNEDVYRAVVEEIGRFVQLDHCSFHTPRLQGTGYHLEAAHEGLPSPMGHEVPEVLTRLMDALTVQADGSRARSARDPLGNGTGAFFGAIMPVTAGQELLGVIGASCNTDASCADLLIRLLERAADSVAVKLMQLRAFQLVRQQDERYHRIINNMDLGLVEVDSHHRITAVNQKFSAMSGFSADALVGNNLLDFPGVQHAAELFEHKRDLRRQGQSDAYELDVHDAKGEHRHWFISGAPSHDQQGQHVGSVNVILDITDRKRMEQDLYEANIKARSSLQAKELFLANMSHEMRTPMNVVLGLCDALIRHEDRPEQLDQLHTVRQATRNLLALTNDILALSRTASGNLAIHPRPTSLHALIAHVAKLFQHQAKAKGLAFTTTVAPGLEAFHSCDAQRLDQVLVNLMGNAIKFTSAGRVDLEVRAEAVSDGKQHVVIMVRDSGMGISPAFQERLFEPFSRDPNIQSAEIEGSGLGLSICKHLIDLMHGGIQLDSTLGQGTVVAISLSLPVVSAASHMIEPEEPPQEIVLPAARILLVEDSTFNRKVVAAMFKGQAIDLLEATHGAEALEILGDRPVDLVLLDLRMPVMDGMEFLRILREQLLDPVPVLILTAGEVPAANDGTSGPVLTHTLQKPFERTELLRSIGDLLEQGARQDAGTSGPTLKNARWDRSTLAGLLGHDPGLMNEIIDAFRQDAPRTLAELTQAARSGDVAGVGALAHRMRPSLHMLGITAVHELIDELIEHGKQGTGQARCPGLVAVIQRIVSEALSQMDI